MIQKMLRGLPMSAYRPLRQAVHDFPRGHPARLMATAVLQRAMRAHRHHLPDRLASFTSAVPQAHNSKDVVLSVGALPA